MNSFPLQIEIPYVDYLDTYQGIDKVITLICWRVSGESDGHKGWSYGTTYIDLDNVSSEEFIAFDDITEEDLKAWIIETLSEQGEWMPIIEGIAKSIEEQNPNNNRSIGLPSNF